MTTPSTDQAYVVTGPTSGIGYRTALALAARGVVILVGRNPAKLVDVKSTIESAGGHAVPIVCDMSDLAAIRRAAAEIAQLPYRVVGLLNNAGIMPTQVVTTAAGLDATFATNHLGAFALTEALAPSLPDGANVVFVASAIEDPERAPARVMGMKGGRFISIEASAHGQWKEGGSKLPGIDAYATSKQTILAAMYGLARETPRLRFNAVEPGINPGTSLGGVHNAAVSFIFGQIVTRLPPFGQFRSTPQRAAEVITRVLTDATGPTGVYFDEKGGRMRGSVLAEDPKFQDEIIRQTRAFLALNP